MDSCGAPLFSAHSITAFSPPGGTLTCASQFWSSTPIKSSSIEPIISVMEPNKSIERPTATNVNARRTGLRMLDLMVSPTVAGRLAVNLWIALDEILTSCCPLRISRGCILDAFHAGQMPETSAIAIAMALFWMTKEGSTL